MSESRLKIGVATLSGCCVLIALGTPVSMPYAASTTPTLRAAFTKWQVHARGPCTSHPGSGWAGGPVATPLEGRPCESSSLDEDHTDAPRPPHRRLAGVAAQTRQ